MQFLKITTLLIFAIFANINNSIAQFRLIKAHSDQEDRIIATNPGLIDVFRNHKQSRKFITPLISQGISITDSFSQVTSFSQKSFNYFAWNNPEFGGNHRTVFTQKSWITKLGGSNLWQNPNRFFSWESEDREDYLVVNPILDLSYSPSAGPFDTSLLNGRGVELYGQMGEKLAFYSQIYDYQANYPFHIDEYKLRYNVYPGLGDVVTNSFGLNDYFYVSAYMDLLLLKKNRDTSGNGYEISSTFGHDKQHIGTGYRSLILSNFAVPTLFLQINYKLGPFRYQNLFKELIRDMSMDASATLNKKYLAMHRGSLLFERLNLELGFSEMITHSRPDNRFDLNYLNPIIFYKAVERQNGSPDNAIVAFDAKYTKGKCVIYGQLIIDELRFSSVFINRNEFRNKFGNQIGFYLNPEFRNFKKSYLQLEYNAVRPYTYSHMINSTNYYASYNQSMAHPLESNFRELIFRFFAIPDNLQRWAFKGTSQIAWKGLNKDGDNYGSDLRIPYTLSKDPDNAIMLQGNLQNRINVMTTVIYYMQPNAKIELTHHWFRSKDEVDMRNFNYLSLSIKYNFTDTRETYLF